MLTKKTKDSKIENVRLYSYLENEKRNNFFFTFYFSHVGRRIRKVEFCRFISQWKFIRHSLLWVTLLDKTVVISFLWRQKRNESNERVVKIHRSNIEITDDLNSLIDEILLQRCLKQQKISKSNNWRSGRFGITFVIFKDRGHPLALAFRHTNRFWSLNRPVIFYC